VRSLPGRAPIVAALLTAVSSSPPPPTTLRAVSGLPAHLAGRFTDLTRCEQTADGTYFVFDRRAHAVYSVPPGAEAPKEIVQIGAEPGRILRPYGFAMARDGTFVIADAPESRGRVQIFLSSGSRLGGFVLPGREISLVTMDGLILNGLGSIAYSGRSVYINRPDSGSLVTELGIDGVSARNFGTLRTTGYEADRDLHYALNSGLIVLNPAGGFYFVFVAGVPMFRKYDANGALLFERHIEGTELDAYMTNRPTAWPRRRTDAGEMPIVRPVIRAAAADEKGNLWIALEEPYTYVYDARGDKQRVVQLRAAGIVTPTSLAFSPSGRLVVTPGCFVFDVP
jgi:hypothetical protein